MANEAADENWPSCRSTTSDTSHESSSAALDLSKEQNVRDHLTSRCHAWVRAINTRDPSHIDASLISPNFVNTSERESGTEKQTLQMAQTYMQQHIKAHPQYQVQILDVKCDVDMQKGQATAYVQIRSYNDPDSVGLEGLSLVEFRRNKDRQWILMKEFDMRGVAPMPF